MTAAARSTPGRRSTDRRRALRRAGRRPAAFFNANTLAELHQLEQSMKTIAEIAAQLQGYDPQALSADAVNDFLARLVAPVAETEQVGMLDALGRVLARRPRLARSACRRTTTPRWTATRSTARSCEPDAPLELEVVGTALAGKAWQGQVGPGQCVKIMTGAIMPAGARHRGAAGVHAAAASTAASPFPAGPAAARRQPPPRGRGPDGGPARAARGERLGPAACGLVASLGHRRRCRLCGGCASPTSPPATRS